MKTSAPNREQMVDIIKKSISPISKTEIIPFEKSVGRICAQDVFSLNTLPNKPVSRFDGIGICFDQLDKDKYDTSHWKLGEQYVFCNTGIAIPEPYDTVIAVEEITIENNILTINELPKQKGNYVGAVGKSMMENEILISKGTVISPAHVGLLASGGIIEICVYSIPNVAIIPTGNELVPPSTNIAPGKNVESNSYMIASYVQQMGLKSTIFPILKDIPELISDTLIQAANEYDLVIIIAGSSLGTDDHTINVLSSIGKVIVSELAHGPGRKSSLSIVKNTPVLGVAGPPMGAQITCDLYLPSIINSLKGIPIVNLQKIDVISDENFKTYGVDFCERIHIYQSHDSYHMRSAFSPKTTRAQLEAIANGNFYRKAGTNCDVGQITTVELLVPIEFIPKENRIPNILEK